MMTIDAAYAMNMDEQVGSIEPGKWADLTVIESDPTTQPSDELWVNAVWATLIDGAVEASVGPTSLCDALAGDS